MKGNGSFNIANTYYGPSCGRVAVLWLTLSLTPSVFGASPGGMQDEQVSAQTAVDTESASEEESDSHAEAAPEDPKPESGIPNTQPTRAEPAQPRPATTENSGSHRLLGLGGAILSEVGFSGVIRLRNEFFGIEFAAGWAPYAVVATDGCDETDVSGALRISGSILAWFLEKDSVSHGMRIGMMHDEFFSWGAMVGYQAEYAPVDWLVLGAGAGFQLFWQGHSPSEMRMESVCEPVSPTIAYPLGGIVQPYLGMSLLFYPF